MSSFDTLII